MEEAYLEYVEREAKHMRPGSQKEVSEDTKNTEDLPLTARLNKDGEAVIEYLRLEEED